VGGGLVLPFDRIPHPGFGTERAKANHNRHSDCYHHSADTAFVAPNRDITKPLGKDPNKGIGQGNSLHRGGSPGCSRSRRLSSMHQKETARLRTSKSAGLPARVNELIRTWLLCAEA